MFRNGLVRRSGTSEFRKVRGFTAAGMEKIGLNEEKSVETLGDIRKWRKGVDREEGLVVWKHFAGWNAEC